jgi:hypothetical protein
LCINKKRDDLVLILESPSTNTETKASYRK